MQDAVYSFEDTGDNLSLLPLAARRALDVAGFRLSLEGYQSLSLEDRLDLTISGAKEAVDTKHVEALVRLSSVPATRIKPANDPDADAPPEQLGPGRRGRVVFPADWQRLRAIDRYALVHTMRRAIAREDPERLEHAIEVILGPAPAPPRSERPRSARPRSDRARRARESEHAALGEPFGSDPVLPAPKDDPARGSARPLRRSAIPDMAAIRDAPAVLGGPRVRERESDAVESRPPVRSAGPRAAISTAPPPPPVLSVPDRHDERRSSFPPSRSERAADLAYDRLERGISRLAPFEEDDPRELSSHLDERGEVRMVDVGAKAKTDRRASASGVVRMRPETALRLAKNDVPKGEVLATARLAGIMAAKRTPELVPLCHAVALTKVEVHLDIERAAGRVTVTAVVEATDRTGVEMEALTAVSVACLTIYDMLKGIDRDMIIDDVKLLQKRGGKRGTYERADD